jgi:hypothetical protein
MILILKKMIYHFKTNDSQAHCLVAQADTLPKPAKELALPTHGLTRIMHETLTANISKLGESGMLKVCTFNKIINGLISRWHGNPSLLILANRLAFIQKTT